jgi:SAM-dependent methyltransferase
MPDIDSRREHESELSDRPETGIWSVARRVQSAVSNGFVHRWAARRIAPNAMVVDAGCGDGRLLRVRPDAAYVGFDFVERLTQRAARYSGCRCFGVADIGALPLRDAVADVLTCFEVLEHLEAVEEVVVEFARVLRRGGTLIVSVPNDEGLKHRLKRDPHPLHHGDMDAARLRGLLDPHFVVRELRFKGIWLFTPGRVSVQVGLRAPRWLATNILVVAELRR